MKRILLCLMVALFATGCLFAKNNDEKMNVMSYNIRYDNSGDKDNQWKFRRDFAADLVKFYEADVFGAQEVLNNQLNDLLNRLPEYAYVGVGREDGKTKGEYAPIFYRKDRFSVEKSGNFWLAEDIINPFTLVVRDLSKIMECPFRAVNKPCDRAGMSQMTRITRISQYLYRLIRRHGIEIASHDYRQILG